MRFLVVLVGLAVVLVVGLGLVLGQGVINAGGGSGATCNLQDPSVSVSPSGQAFGVGDVVSYTVSVTNNDDVCAHVFGLSVDCPSGLSCSLGDSSLLVDNGSSASTTLSVSGGAAGSYTVTVFASDVDHNLAGSASATADVCQCYFNGQCLQVGDCLVSGSEGVYCGDAGLVDVLWVCLTDTYPSCQSMGLDGPFACPVPSLDVCISDGSGPAIGADWCGQPASENYRAGACFNGFDDDGDGLQDCADPDCAGVVNPSNANEVCCQTDADCPVSGGVVGYCDSPNGAKGSSPYSYKCFWPPCASRYDCADTFCCTYEVDKSTQQCVSEGTVLSVNGVSYLCDPVNGWSSSSLSSSVNNADVGAKPEPESNFFEQVLAFIYFFFQR